MTNDKGNPNDEARRTFGSACAHRALGLLLSSHASPNSQLRAASSLRGRAIGVVNSAFVIRHYSFVILSSLFSSIRAIRGLIIKCTRKPSFSTVALGHVFLR